MESSTFVRGSEPSRGHPADARRRGSRARRVGVRQRAEHRLGAGDRFRPAAKAGDPATMSAAALTTSTCRWCRRPRTTTTTSTTTTAPRSTTTTKPPTTTTTVKAPTTATTVRPVSDTPQPARDVRLWPFASTSVWNTPLGAGTTFDGRTIVTSAEINSSNGFGVSAGNAGYALVDQVNTNPYAESHYSFVNSDGVSATEWYQYQNPGNPNRNNSITDLTGSGIATGTVPGPVGNFHQQRASKVSQLGGLDPLLRPQLGRDPACSFLGAPEQRARRRATSGRRTDRTATPPPCTPGSCRWVRSSPSRPVSRCRVGCRRPVR